MSAQVRKTIYRILFAMILTLLMTGCGQEKQQQDVSSEAQRVRKEYKDILSCSWVAPDEEATEQEGWGIVRYIPCINSFSDASFQLSGKEVLIQDDVLYEVLEWENADADNFLHCYELKAIDLQTEEQQILVPDLSRLDFRGKLEDALVKELGACLEKRYAWVISFDGSEGNLHMFLPVWDVTWTIQHYYDLALTPKGEVIEVVDYVDSLWTPQERTAGMFRVPGAVCGEKGRVYFFDEELDEIRVVEKEGTVVASLGVKKAYQTLLRCIGKNPDGVPIFSYVPEEGEVEIFTVEESGENPIFRGKMIDCKKVVDRFGNVWMLQGKRLMVWNVESGRFHEIYRFEGLENYTCLDMSGNDEGELLLCYDGGGDTFVYRMTDGEHPERKELVLLQSSQDVYTAKCAADYNRTHPDVEIRVEEMDSRDDFAWSKLVENIKAGKGPDLILCRRKQINTLQEAKVICPLESYLPEDVRENVFAGALRFGEFDSRLYAIPFEASLDIFMVDSKNWKDGCWTLGEAMDAYEAWKKENPRGERFESIYYRADSYQLLYDLCLKGIEHSEFLDLQTMTCDFESDGFCRLLRFCLENGDNNENNGFSLTKDEQMDEFMTDRAFTYPMPGGLKAYSYYRKSFGENVHAVGFPSTDMVRSVVFCGGGVALSSLSENKEVAIDFLLSLLSRENQIKYTTNWIRKDVLKERVKDGQKGIQGRETPYFEINAHGRVPLDGRKDGTSYLDEYLELMEGGVSESIQYEIQDIVTEEVKPFFAGEKSEREVAGIIQNRVRLFLEEQK